MALALRLKVREVASPAQLTRVEMKMTLTGKVDDQESERR